MASSCWGAGYIFFQGFIFLVIVTAHRLIRGCHSCLRCYLGCLWLLVLTAHVLNHLSWHSSPSQTDAKITIFNSHLLQVHHTSLIYSQSGPFSLLLGPLWSWSSFCLDCPPPHLSESYHPSKSMSVLPSPRKPSLIIPIRGTSCSNHSEFLSSI